MGSATIDTGVAVAVAGTSVGARVGSIAVGGTASTGVAVGSATALASATTTEGWLLAGAGACGLVGCGGAVGMAVGWLVAVGSGVGTAVEVGTAVDVGNATGGVVGALGTKGAVVAIGGSALFFEPAMVSKDAEARSDDPFGPVALLNTRTATTMAIPVATSRKTWFVLALLRGIGLIQRIEPAGSSQNGNAFVAQMERGGT